MGDTRVCANTGNEWVNGFFFFGVFWSVGIIWSVHKELDTMLQLTLSLHFSVYTKVLVSGTCVHA